MHIKCEVIKRDRKCSNTVGYLKWILKYLNTVFYSSKNLFNNVFWYSDKKKTYKGFLNPQQVDAKMYNVVHIHLHLLLVSLKYLSQIWHKIMKLTNHCTPLMILLTTQAVSEAYYLPIRLNIITLVTQFYVSTPCKYQSIQICDVTLINQFRSVWLTTPELNKHISLV